MTVTTADVDAGLPDLDVLALTAWAEARGDAAQGHSSVEERIAVMAVIRNRLAHPTRWRAAAASYKAICLAHLQFSCWNDGPDPNHLAVLALAARLMVGQDTGDPLLDETIYLAQGIVSGVILDRTNGADSYFAPTAMVPHGRTPAWAKGLEPTALIGRQLFFKLNFGID